MDKLRRLLFVSAYVALLLAVAFEGGAGCVGKGAREITAASLDAVRAEFGDSPPPAEELRLRMQRVQGANEAPPGFGIPHLALVDGVLLLVMTWMVLSFFVPQAIQARVQGIISLIVALSLLITSVIRIFTTIAVLMVMISLVASGPFGFIAYMAIWGFFEAGTARAILSMSMFLKLTFAVLLIAAHQQFLKVKSMLFIVVTSLVLTFVTMFLIRFVPSFLASITDAIAGIINAVLAAIWAIVLLVMSLVSVIRAVRIDRAMASSDGA